jgi:release factor glutamine methyltransferase
LVLPHTRAMNLNCTWREMMREAAQRLGAAGIEIPARDARLLLAHALAVEPVEVIAREMDAVDPVGLTVFEQAIQRRLAGEPVSRIRGWREFYGRKFRISPDVLDPRPETELLVSEGLKLLPANGRVLDLGTGSGCILLSVLAERPGASGVGVDISPAALEVARENAQALRVADRASFVEWSWTEADPHLTSTNHSSENVAPPPFRGRETSPAASTNLPPPARGRGHMLEKNGGRDQVGVGLNSQAVSAFDLVLSNPPYIAEADLTSLPKDVRAYDPGIALTPGADALAAYRAILALVPRLMKPGASIGFEVGQGQDEAVRSLMANAGLTGLAVFPDLAGIPRAAFGRRPG